MPKDVLIKVACTIWPILRPEIQRIVDDSSTPIDDWVLRVLDALMKALCEEEE